MYKLFLNSSLLVSVILRALLQFVPEIPVRGLQLDLRLRLQGIQIFPEHILLRCLSCVFVEQLIDHLALLCPAFFAVCHHIVLEPFPVPRVLNIPFRAILPCHVVMADDIIALQSIFLCQVSDQVDIRPVRRIRKPAAFVMMTVLDGNRIIIRLIGCSCHFAVRNALDDFTLGSHHVVGAHIGILKIFQALKIVPVLLRTGLRIPKVMDNDLLDRVHLDARS